MENRDVIALSLHPKELPCTHSGVPVRGFWPTRSLSSGRPLPGLVTTLPPAEAGCGLASSQKPSLLQG